MQHDFQQSLALSHSASDLPIWGEIYGKAFVGGVMVDHRQDGEHQRAGIDRSVIMPNSKQILIDEKVRFKNKITGRVYNDIALEYISVDTSNVAGWACKPLRCDYICYAIVPIGRAYLLPTIILQQAWLKYGELWRSKYHSFAAQNNGYKTWSVGVPVNELYKAMGEFLRIQFTALDM